MCGRGVRWSKIIKNMHNKRISMSSCSLKKRAEKIPLEKCLDHFERTNQKWNFFPKNAKSWDLPDRDSPDQTLTLL